MNIPNFRDFGGSPSRFGGAVVRDKLFRSAQPVALDAATRDQLLGMNLSRIIDLRYVSEQSKKPTVWPAEYADRILAHGQDSFSDSAYVVFHKLKPTDVAAVDKYYVDFYRDLPFDEYYRPFFRRALLALLDAAGAVLIHCSQGKDRTGLLVALLLHSLGVSRDAIVADFLLSQNAVGLVDQGPAMLEGVRQDMGYAIPLAVLERSLTVQEHYLREALSAIETQCASIDRYLDHIGVTADHRQALRDRFLSR